MPSDRFNIMWVGPITEFTITEHSIANLASTCLSNNISTVVFSVGSWIKYSGGYYTFPYALPESASTLQNICRWCHSNGLVVGASLYSDYNASSQFSIDVSTIGNRNSEVSAVTTILSYGFDFYIDDTEGYTGKLSDIIAFWGNMSAAIHAVNKVSAVYYGMHAWPQGYIDDVTVFNSFTSQDFIVARFHPGAATASTELSLIRDHLPCKWMTQVRVDEGQDNITSSAVFYNKTFSSGFDANFQGHSLWAWYSNEIIPIGRRGVTGQKKTFLSQVHILHLHLLLYLLLHPFLPQPLHLLHLQIQHLPQPPPQHQRLQPTYTFSFTNAVTFRFTNYFTFANKRSSNNFFK